MWTSAQIDELRARLKTAADEALDNDDFDAYRRYKSALKQITTASPETALDDLAQLAENTLGHELFSKVSPKVESQANELNFAAVGPDRVEQEPPTNERAGNDMLPGEVSLPRKSHQGSVSSVDTQLAAEVNQPTPATSQPAVEISQPPPVVSQPAAEQVPPIPTTNIHSGEQVLTSASQPVTLPEAPPEKLEKLRQVKHEGTNLDMTGLGDWVRRLRKAAEEVRHYGSFQEVDEALNLARTGDELLKISARIQAGQGELEAARVKKDLPRIYNLLTRAAAIERQLQEARFAGFGYLVSEIAEQALAFKAEAEADKKRVADQLNIYITMSSLENYEGALKELLASQEQGIEMVPSSTEADEIISVFEAIRAKRAEYLNFCIRKTSEYLAKARRYLQETSDEAVDLADTECINAAKMATTPELKAELEKEPIIEEVKKVRSQIDALLKNRQAAVEFLDKAFEMDPLKALQELQNLTYKRLERMNTVRKDLQDKLRDQKRGPLNQALQRAASLRFNRQYSGQPETALEILLACKADLETTPTSLVDLAALIAPVDEAIKRTQEEEREWMLFSEYRQKVTKKVLEGKADASTLEEVKTRGKAYWETNFNADYNQLLSLVARQSGDLSILRQARGVYDANPADEQIGQLLGPDKDGKFPISQDHPELAAEAAQILYLHKAQVILMEARDHLRNYAALITTPAAWLNTLTDTIAKCKNPIRRLEISEAQEIRTNADTLLALARTLQATWNEAVEKLHRQEYSLAVERLEMKLEAAGEDSELSEGIRALLNHTRQIWRADRMRFIQNRIEAPGVQPSLDDYEKAAGYMNELQTAHALDQDGDDLIATRVSATWHTREVESILGEDLDSLTEARILVIGQRQDIDWKRLFEHLEGVLKYRFGYDGATQWSAGRLRMVALGNYGLQTERLPSIERLKQEVNTQVAVTEAAGVYVVLTLRYLEDDNNLREAQAVVQRLKGASQRSEKVAAGLEKMIEAHRLYQSNDLRMAVATLDAGVEILKGELPELARAIQDEVNHTTNQWYLDLGEKLLGGVLPELRKLDKRAMCPPEQYFDYLDQLNQASQYLPGDRRIAEGVRLLSRFSQAIADKLLEGVQAQLVNEQERLQTKVDQGNRNLGWLQIAFADHTVLPTTSPAWVELNDMLAEYSERVTRWKKALEKLKELRNQIRCLFVPPDGVQPWSWNSDFNREPTKTLKAFTSSAGQVTALAGYSPVELARLRDFVTAFGSASDMIKIEFEVLSKLIKDDRLERYEQAMLKINSEKGMRATQEKWTTSLNQAAVEAFPEPLTISLNPFYQIESPFPELERGRDCEWSETGGAITCYGLDEIEQYIKEMLQSCAAWGEWRDEAVACLQKLHKDQRDARNFLGRGHRLGEAANLCREEIDELLNENEERGQIPARIKTLAELGDLACRKMEPPRCAEALRSARPDEENRPAERTAGKALPQAFDALLAASRSRVQSMWRRYLALEIAAALLDLGPSVSDLSEKENLPLDWQAVWKPEVAAALPSIEIPPKQEPLQSLIDKNLAELYLVVGEIDKHINRFNRSAKSITVHSQNTLKNLLDQALRIDDKAPRVEGAMEKYQAGEIMLKAKAG